MVTLYEVLEVSEKASNEVIEKAYKVLAKRYHPDLQQESGKLKAEEKMKKINEAYDILSDIEKRKEYDISLKEAREYEKAKEAEKIIKEAIRQKKYYSRNNNTQEEYQLNRTSMEYSTTKQEKPESEIRYQNTVYTEQKKKAYVTPEQAYWEQKQKEFQQEYLLMLKNLDGDIPEKKKERIIKRKEKELENKYLEDYDDYLRKRGYTVKFRWTIQKVKRLLKLILIAIIIMIGLWKIPFTHDFLVKLYENNRVVKILVDIIIGIVNGTRDFFLGI